MVSLGVARLAPAASLPHATPMDDTSNPPAEVPAEVPADPIAILAGHAPGDLFEAERAVVIEGDGAPLAAALPDADERGRRRLLAVIARIGAPAGQVAPLIASPEPTTRLAAAKALGACGPDAAAPLVGALPAAKGALRVEIARSLGRCGHPDAVAALAPLVAADPAARTAVDALGALALETARAPLLHALSAAEDPKASAAAAKALGRLDPDPETTRVLLAAFIEGETHELRRNAIGALSEAAAPIDADHARLTAALDGPHAREAKRAIERLTGQSEA